MPLPNEAIKRSALFKPSTHSKIDGAKERWEPTFKKTSLMLNTYTNA